MGILSDTVDKIRRRRYKQDEYLMKPKSKIYKPDKIMTDEDKEISADIRRRRKARKEKNK